MIAPTLKLGGPLAIECTSCGAHVGDRCVRKHRAGSAPMREPRAAHAARVKAAPPEQEARAGDLVLVQVGGVHLAQLVAMGENCTVRIWRAGAQAFASPRLVSRAAVLSLAPEDVRAKLARDQLDVEALHTERARNKHLYDTDPKVRAAVDAALDFSEATPRRVAAGYVTKLDAQGQPAEVEIFEAGHSPSEPSPAPVTRAPDPWFASMPPETTGGKGW